MLPLKLRSLSISKSNPREIQAQEISRNNQHQRVLSSVPESSRHQYRTSIATSASAVPNSRDDYLYKQIPKKSVTMIPKQTTLSRDKPISLRKHSSSASMAQSQLQPQPQPQKLINNYQPSPPVLVPTTTRRQTLEHASKPTRNYGRKLPESGKLENIFV